MAGLPARAPMAAPPAAPIIAPLARRSPVSVPQPASSKAAAKLEIRSVVRMAMLLLYGAGTHHCGALFRSAVFIVDDPTGTPGATFRRKKGNAAIPGNGGAVLSEPEGALR